MTRPLARIVAAALLLSSALPFAALSGCSGASSGVRTPRSFAVQKSYEGAQATVRLKVDRTSITVAESILVVLEADAYENASVSLPASVPAGKGESFTVVESEEEPAHAVAGGVMRSSRWFRLEPFLSGSYTLEPLSVVITDTKGGKRTVHTDEIAVTVTSLLPKDYEKLDIKDIEGIIRPPWRPPAWAWIAFGILAVSGAGTGLWLWLQKRALSRLPPPERAAHEIAYEALDSLLAEKLVEHGEVKLFYQRVTSILRQYIERRFGLRAPERTTEEFLWELKETDLLTEEMKKLLRAFLQHGDLVKFAQLRPLRDEIDSTLGSCRDFIRSTEPAVPADSTPGASTPAPQASRPEGPGRTGRAV